MEAIHESGSDASVSSEDMITQPPRKVSPDGDAEMSQEEPSNSESESMGSSKKEDETPANDLEDSHNRSASTPTIHISIGAEYQAQIPELMTDAYSVDLNDYAELRASDQLKDAFQSTSTRILPVSRPDGSLVPLNSFKLSLHSFISVTGGSPVQMPHVGYFMSNMSYRQGEAGQIIMDAIDGKISIKDGSVMTACMRPERYVFDPILQQVVYHKTGEQTNLFSLLEHLTFIICYYWYGKNFNHYASVFSELAKIESMNIYRCCPETKAKPIRARTLTEIYAYFRINKQRLEYICRLLEISFNSSANSIAAGSQTKLALNDLVMKLCSHPEEKTELIEPGKLVFPLPGAVKGSFGEFVRSVFTPEERIIFLINSCNIGGHGKKEKKNTDGCILYNPKKYIREQIEEELNFDIPETKAIGGTDVRFSNVYFRKCIPLECFAPKYTPLNGCAYPTPTDIPYNSSNTFLKSEQEYDKPWNSQALSILAPDVSPQLQWASMPILPDPEVLITELETIILQY